MAAASNNYFETVSLELLDKDFNPFELMKAMCRKKTGIFSMDEILAVQELCDDNKTRKGISAFCKLLTKRTATEVVYVAEAARSLDLGLIAKTVEDEIMRVCLDKTSDIIGTDVDQTKASVFQALIAMFNRCPDDLEITARKQQFIEQLENAVVSWYANLSLINETLPTFQHNSSQKFKTHNVPLFSETSYLNRPVENEILEKLEKLSRHPTEGALLVKGGGGLGKTTLMAYLLTSRQNEEFFKRNCNIHIAIWLNCFEWRESFDEQAFVFKLLYGAAKVAGLNTIFSDLKNMVAYFEAQKLRLLVLFDDMFNATLLKFFRECCPTVACCVVTREVWEIYLIEKTRMQSYMMQAVVEVPDLTDEEVKTALKTTYSIKLDCEKITNLAKKCLRLPLIVGLIGLRFRWCTDQESYMKEYRKVMAEHISNREITDNDKKQNTVSHLFQLSIDGLRNEQDFLRYCAFLTFNPAQLVGLEHLAAFWGLEIDSAREQCDLFEMLSLVRKVAANNNSEASPSFLVHQMLYEACETVATTRLFGDKVYSSEDSQLLLRFKLLTMRAYTALVESLKIIPSEIYGNELWNEIFRKQNRFLLGLLVEELEAYHLSRLCMLKGNFTGNKTVLHYLYGIRWRDDAENVEDQGRDLIRHSFRIISTILRKVRRAIAASSLIKPIRNILSVIDNNERSLLFDLFENEGKLANCADHCQLCHLAEPWRPINEERKWLQEKLKHCTNKPDYLESINYAVLKGDAQLVEKVWEHCGNAEEVQEAGLDATRLGYLDITIALYMRFPDVFAQTNSKALTWASRNGHIDVVKFLSGKYPDASKVVESDSRTPLLWASRNGHLEVVHFLYENHSDGVKIADEDEQTPLFWASRSGHMDVVSFLYGKYPQAVKLADTFGQTPLLAASLNGHLEVVQFLYHRYPEAAGIADNVGKLPLSEASWLGHMEVVQFLFDNFPEAAKMEDLYGQTPLSLATMNGHLEVVKFLYEKYPKAAETMDHYRRTPLLWACRNGHLEVALFLYERYPEAAEIADNDRQTPLFWASLYGHMKLVTLASERYPETTKLGDNFLQTTLFAAASNGHMEVVDFLFRKYPKAAEIENRAGRTPLFAASVNGYLGVVKSLYEKYPEAIKFADNDNQTALFWASRYGHMEVVDYLYEKFPEAVKLLDKDGQTPLFSASVNGHIDVVKFLYEKYPGAVKIKNKNGRTPLFAASVNGHVELAKFLSEKYSEATKIEDKFGQTPVYAATVNGHLAVVKLLVGGRKTS